MELKFINDKGVYTISDKNFKPIEVYCDLKYITDLDHMDNLAVMPDKHYEWTVRLRLLLSLCKLKVIFKTLQIFLEL